mgnify:CR=1 FL=1
MKIDALVAEIGSTTTVVNAFDNLSGSDPVFLGQGFAPTTVLDGDVTVGLKNAMSDLAKNLGANTIEARETFASSSAAGGLKMSVHGLVYDMTVKAAREAALGAGANLRLVTAGLLSEDDVSYLASGKLNIIMIAGGVDYGETETALENAKKIASLRLNVPVIYAGNSQNQPAIRRIFREVGQEDYLFVTKNVYPSIDKLEIEEARKIIQSVFEKHIIRAPGMEKVREEISSDIIPTPGAVMEAAILLYREIGDLVAFDVGGATTDIHSVTAGSEKNEKIMLGPEPFAKRTVEGDLGVYINRDNIIDLVGKDKLADELKISEQDLDALLSKYKAIPDPDLYPLVSILTYEALKCALERHSGHYIHLYGASGKTTLAEGKDLSAVRYAIGTGGALTRLPDKHRIISRVLSNRNDLLMKPPVDATILIDEDYIMASLGVLSRKHPEAASIILKKSLGIG